MHADFFFLPHLEKKCFWFWRIGCGGGGGSKFWCYPTKSNVKSTSFSFSSWIVDWCVRVFGCVCNISIIDLEIVKNKKNKLLLFCYNKLNQNMFSDIWSTRRWLNLNSLRWWILCCCCIVAICWTLIVIVLLLSIIIVIVIVARSRTITTIICFLPNQKKMTTQRKKWIERKKKKTSCHVLVSCYKANSNSLGSSDCAYKSSFVWLNFGLRE